MLKDNPFYLYMKEQRGIAWGRAYMNRLHPRMNPGYAKVKYAEYLYYKVEMKKWRFRMKKVRVKLGCYYCFFFYSKDIKCNEGHKHLPKITCIDFKSNGLLELLLK